jgi:hypothetical protein
VMGRGLSPLQKQLLADAREHDGKITTRHAKLLTNVRSKTQSVVVCRALQRLEKRFLMWGWQTYGFPYKDYELTDEGRKFLSVSCPCGGTDTNKNLSVCSVPHGEHTNRKKRLSVSADPGAEDTNRVSPERPPDSRTEGEK